MSASHEMEENFAGGFLLSDEDEEPATQESYRREIEDIVKGFILEKEILVQGHQEEISRMRDAFSSERGDLYKHFEMERDELWRSSRRNTSPANESGTQQVEDFESHTQARALSASPSETNARGSGTLSPRKSRHYSGQALNGANSNPTKEISDDFVSHTNHAYFLSNPTSGISVRDSGNSTPRKSRHYAGQVSDTVDLNLVREIAEVYMRVNSGATASHVRPDLDLEDKFEREREALERRFQAEKRELKRKLEDDHNQKLEQERSRYEEHIQELKTVNSDLQWQKREQENRVRHEKEKWELSFEREKNDFEKRQLQSIQDIRRKLEEKHSVELQKQRQRYEENISELQADIAKLTAQLRELNEHLTQEKDIIMMKFEREIKEMEQAFVEQRNALRICLESEFAIRLENETTVLKTVNGKLNEDLETLEREKKEIEKKCRDERRKLEENYDEEISETERRHSEEKRNIKLKFEERFQQLLERDTAALEETIMELRDEVVILREENSHMELALNERSEEFRRQIELERDDMKRKLMDTREEIKVQLEADYSQKILIANASREDQYRQQDRDTLSIKAKFDESEMKLVSMREEKERILRDKEQLEKKIKDLESDLGNQSNARMCLTSSREEMEKLRGIISAKENEVASVKLENQQLEINLSAMKREKMDLEDEIAILKRKLTQVDSRASDQTRAVDNSELVYLQDALRRKDEELRALQRDKFEAESRQASLQRKNEELEDELAILRRKKLEVEDEISAVKRDKADLDNHLTSLRKEKADFEELTINLKRKMADLEDTMSASKRDKMDLEHEISLLKRRNTTMEIDIQRSHCDHHERAITLTQEHAPHERLTQQSLSELTVDTSHYFLEGEDGAISKKEAIELEAKVRELAKKKWDLEEDIRKLAQEKEEAEKAGLQAKSKEGEAENQGITSESSWILNKQKEELEQKISALKEEHLDLERKLSHLRRDEARTEESFQNLKHDREDLEGTVKTLKFDKNALEKAIESIKREKSEHEGERALARETAPLNNAPKHNHPKNAKDKEIARLTGERNELEEGISTVKSQLTLLQSELSATKSVQFNQESLQMDEKEISRLKKSRLELERQIAVLKRQKTELEAEITVIDEVKTREEKDLTSSRRERVELDIQLTALQCKKTRLDAEISMIKDDRKKSENEIENMRRERTSMAKQVYDIQSQKLKLEADVEVVEDNWRKKGTAVSGLSSDVVHAEKQLAQLRGQKADLQTEIIRLQSSKNKEESDIAALRQQKLEFERQMTVQKTQTYHSSHSRSPRFLAHSGRVGQDESSLAEEDKLRYSQSRKAEHSQGESSSALQVNGFQEGGGLSFLGSDGQYSRDHWSPRSQTHNAAQGEAYLTKEEQLRQRHVKDSSHHSTSTKIQINRFQEAGGLSSRGRDEDHSSSSLAGSSRNAKHNASEESHSGRFPGGVLRNQEQYNGYSSHEISGMTSARSHSHGTVKEDNDVVSLTMEKQDLQLQISELRIQLTKLQTEVTEIENRKTVLGTNDSRRTVSSSIQHNRQFSGFQGESNVAHARTEVGIVL